MAQSVDSESFMLPELPERINKPQYSDFSVVLFRSDFVLLSEEHLHESA